jgi:hypothetical protein
MELGRLGGVFGLVISGIRPRISTVFATAWKGQVLTLGLDTGMMGNTVPESEEFGYTVYQ